MTTQHTPGHWHVDDCLSAVGFTTVRPFDGTPHGDTEAAPIATVYEPDHARLIAAAPDLLATLKAIAAIADPRNGDRGPIRQARHIAKCAIAKAEGR